MTDEPKCIGCPFRRDCPDCPWKGGTVAPQADSAPSVVRNGAIRETMTGTTEAAPAVRQHCSPGPDRYEGAAMPDATPNRLNLTPERANVGGA